MGNFYCFLAIKKRIIMRTTAPLKRKTVRGESVRKFEGSVEVAGGEAVVDAGGGVVVATADVGGEVVFVVAGGWMLPNNAYVVKLDTEVATVFVAGSTVLDSLTHSVPFHQAAYRLVSATDGSNCESS